MALIKNFEMKSFEVRGKVHKEARATVEVFVDNGQKYIQIDSYGSSERVFKDTVSQTMQFDMYSAKEIYDLIRAAYNFS